MIRHVIKEENFLCETEEQLANVLHTRISEWILERRPNHFEVLGPWKDFVKALENDTEMQQTQKIKNVGAITENENNLKESVDNEFDQIMQQMTS